MAKLLFLFIVVPAVELALLIEVGERIGTLSTLALIAGTGVVGAALANHQGIRTLRTIQERLEAGELPASAMLDGVILLIAGALLVTPGILTDAIGFACLVPAVRALVKRDLQRRFEQAVRDQKIHVVGVGFDGGPGRRPMTDVTSRSRRIDADADAEDPPREG